MPNIPTLAEVLDEYIASGRVSSDTAQQYRAKLKRCVPDWLNLEITLITKDMIAQRHRDLTPRGATQSNAVMRILRAMFTFAAVKWESEDGTPLIPINPVRRLSQLKQWHKERPRKSVIQFTHLKTWVQAVQQLENQTIKDYLLFILLTGLRRMEAAQLTWKNVDLQSGFICVHRKGGEDCTLPVSDYLWDMLRRRKAIATNEYVFPGRYGEYLTSPYNSCAEVRGRSGLQFSLHDLRRTFSNVAAYLKFNDDIRKRLMNHALTDTTNKHYTAFDPEWLRPEMQQITDFVLETAGIREAHLEPEPARVKVRVRQEPAKVRVISPPTMLGGSVSIAAF